MREKILDLIIDNLIDLYLDNREDFPKAFEIEKDADKHAEELYTMIDKAIPEGQENREAKNNVYMVGAASIEAGFYAGFEAAKQLFAVSKGGI